MAENKQVNCRFTMTICEGKFCFGRQDERMECPLWRIANSLDIIATSIIHSD